MNLPPRVDSLRPATSHGGGVPLNAASASALNLAAPQKPKRPAPLILSPSSTAHLPWPRLCSSRKAHPSPPLCHSVANTRAEAIRPDTQESRQVAQSEALAPKIPKFSRGKESPSTAPNFFLTLAQAHKSETHLPSALNCAEPVSEPPVPSLPPPPPSVPQPLQRPTTPLPHTRRPSTRGNEDILPQPEPVMPPSPLPLFVPYPTRRAPQPPPPPQCVSAFDFDSDSESDGETQSLARRILGGLAGHHHHHRGERDSKNHKRSASDGKKNSGISSGKGSNAGTEPVRRARTQIPRAPGLCGRPGSVMTRRTGRQATGPSQRGRARMFLDACSDGEVGRSSCLLVRLGSCWRRMMRRGTNDS